jgi:UDP:flavonoid glycosyltransferase YjiC (YdhE family)
VNAGSIEAALRRVLSDRDIRRAAADVADEVAAMPTPAQAADGILAWLRERGR